MEKPNFWPVQQFQSLLFPLFTFITSEVWWFPLDWSDIQQVFSEQMDACWVESKEENKSVGLCLKFIIVSRWTNTTSEILNVRLSVLSTPWWTCCPRWWWVSRTLSAASSPTTTGRRWASARRGWWCSCATPASWRRWTSGDRATRTASCLRILSTGKSRHKGRCSTAADDPHLYLHLHQSRWREE